MAVQTRLDECLSIRDGRLFIEECDADALARRFGTPITGAYQDGLACNFNALPRPGMVLVTGDEAEWIKRPETVADVFQRDVVPARLRSPR